jgi:hypothetical protein
MRTAASFGIGRDGTGKPLFLEPVTDPIKRFDYVEKIVDTPKFRAQPLDMAVDRVIIDIVLISVDGSHQGAAGLHHARTGGERRSPDTQSLLVGVRPAASFRAAGFSMPTLGLQPCGAYIADRSEHARASAGPLVAVILREAHDSPTLTARAMTLRAMIPPTSSVSLELWEPQCKTFRGRRPRCRRNGLSAC